MIKATFEYNGQDIVVRADDVDSIDAIGLKVSFDDGYDPSESEWAEIKELAIEKLYEVKHESELEF